jgi:hypothetical protein
MQPLIADLGVALTKLAVLVQHHRPRGTILFPVLGSAFISAAMLGSLGWRNGGGGMEKIWRRYGEAVKSGASAPAGTRTLFGNCQRRGWENLPPEFHRSDEVRAEPRYSPG